MSARLADAGVHALARDFYARNVLVVARDVLGRVLVHDGPHGRQSGRIVEVEAYRGGRDPASHAFRGPTRRNAVMFGPPGHLYVYFTYGMHECMNLTCEPLDSAAALLVRALEPLEGIDVMRRLRGIDAAERLARGPGCVTRALGLSRAHDGLDLTSGPVWVEGERELGGRAVGRSPRVGITVATERPWRFFLVGHPCVSGPAGLNRAPERRKPRPPLTPRARSNRPSGSNGIPV